MWEDEYHELSRLLAWFDEHLECPDRFCRSNKPGRQPKAVCWFKSSATAHLKKAWEMVAILENNETRIHMIKAATPGYVVYEDEFQIAAEPFADLKRQEMR